MDNTKSEQKKENTFIKKIGSTTYKVNVNFSKTSKETMTDKIIRLIKNDGLNSKQ